MLGMVHFAWLAAIAAAAILLTKTCRRRVAAGGSCGGLLHGFGLALACNEGIWWGFRYSHEGLHVWNLPLQLCDVTVWGAVFACLTAAPAVAEFTYFAGLAGAGMALLTPDLWSPWPSYPAAYFFLAHGGVVIAAAMLGFGGAARFRRGAPWRAFRALLGYAALAGAVDAITGANYMYLRRKPAAGSLLNAFGPWPWYLFPSAAAAALIFRALWIPARRAQSAGD